VGEAVGSDHRPLLVEVESARPPPSGPPPRFALRKADWPRFEAEVEAGLRSFQPGAGSEHRCVSAFAALILKAAKRSCPMGTRRNPRAWWTEECTEVAERLRAAEEAVAADATDATLAELADARATASETFDREKRRTWQEFTSSLSLSTPPGKVWSVLRGMDGRAGGELPSRPLRSGLGKLAVGDRDKSNLLISHYASVSRLRLPKAERKKAYKAVRARIREGAEPEAATDFSAAELDAALSRARGKAPGPDRILNTHLRHLPPAGKAALLAVVNRVWRSCWIPSAWRRATILPLPKPGKPPDEPKSYRPVSLCSNLAKLADSMFNRRLQTWAVETGIVPEEQSGFLPRRSTTDAVLSVTQPAFDGLSRKQPAERTVAVALDFTAAYDRVPHLLLLANLADAGCPSHWLRWLRSWLADRRARVQWKAAKSRERVFEQGLPQGAASSCTLWVLFARTLPAAVHAASPSAAVAVYADDSTIVARGSRRDLSDAAAIAQPALKAVVSWCTENRVSIAPAKTEGLLITRDPEQGLSEPGKKRKAYPPPPLKVADTAVTYHKSIRLLGVRLDSGLNFGSHTAAVAKRMGDRLNILRSLAGTSWGASEAVLRPLYKGYIRPLATYAGPAWWPFLAKSHRETLERKQLAAARIITGLPPSSNSAATRVEAGLPPLGALITRDSAWAWYRYARWPADHLLARLARTPTPPNRLTSRSSDTGYKTSWRTEAEATLRRALGLHRAPRPPPWPPPTRWRRGAEGGGGGAAGEGGEGGVGEGEEEWDMPGPTLAALKAEEERMGRAAYEAAVDANHVHRRASGGNGLNLGHLPRKTATALHRLRLGRFPFLASEQKRLGKAEDETCLRCGLIADTVDHFVVACPRLEEQRRAAFGPKTGRRWKPEDRPTLQALQHRPDETADFIHRCCARL
jgi:hypothetical protein